QALALTDHHQQATPAVVVLLMRAQVLAEFIYALGKQRDLNGGRPGVGAVTPVLADDFSLLFSCEWHGSPSNQRSLRLGSACSCVDTAPEDADSSRRAT